MGGDRDVDGRRFSPKRLTNRPMIPPGSRTKRSLSQPGTRRAGREVADLPGLRRARGLSQEVVARELGTSQPEVSRIEHREDLHLSTLRRYVEALGGRLEMTAHFPDRTVVIAQSGQAAADAA